MDKSVAADQSHTSAQYHYGFLLEHGDGIPIDKHLLLIIPNSQPIKAIRVLNTIMTSSSRLAMIF
jgi:TPR repeat protein